MDSTDFLSNLIIYMKYAKKDESWYDLINRNKQMHISKFPNLKTDIESYYQHVYAKKVLPSMRSLQFGGLAIEVNPVRMYNCAFLPINDIKSFPEIMFLLLSGCGVGFSVQSHHINVLPCIKKPNPQKNKRYLVADSIEGWADAVKVLIKSYFQTNSTICFDFRCIRPKGSLLRTSGGLAPGHEGLEHALLKIRHILHNKTDGEKLTSIECHDIACYIAGAVLSGGIRRSAMISLFSQEDNDMFVCKTNNFYTENPQRCFANNSMVMERHLCEETEFKNIWKRIFAINTGEPGIFLTNDKELGTNPCGEISLNPYQFCNLVEINVSDIESEQDFYERCKAASFIATLQSTYTDFHYLRSIWKKTTEKENLIGVSMTGLASNTLTQDMMMQGAKHVKQENERLSKLLAINRACRCCTIKPSGTASLVLNSTGSGIHAAFDYYYIRRVRINKTEPIHDLLLDILPSMIEDDFVSHHTTSVLSVPIKSSNTQRAIVNEPVIDFLNRIKSVFTHWIIPGHVKGKNYNNVSATVTVKQEDQEQVINWLYDNMNFYNGITIFPYYEKSSNFVQLPYESIDEHTYENMAAIYSNASSELQKVFMTQSIPPSVETYTDVNDYNNEIEPACAGGQCELLR
jgi:ribonucleoside-diphosphate reductase alpha chain